MNKYNIVAFIIIMALVAVPVIAQIPAEESQREDPVPTSSGELDDEVDKLKEKVAETVSELKGESEEATSGIIQSIEGDTLELKVKDEVLTITLDDTLTQYFEISGNSTNDIDKDTLEEGDYVFILGPNISGQITANAIYTDQPYKIISGKITDVNSDDFTIGIVSLDKTNYTLDVQTRTDQEMFDIKSFELETIGFSKLKEGDSIHVVVKNDLSNPESTRFDAERFIIIPNEYFIQ